MAFCSVAVDMLTALRLAAGLARVVASNTTGRIAAVSGLFVLAMLFALIGFAGFGAALWIWLAQVLDPISASLIIGGFGFLLAAVFLLIAQSKAKAPSLLSSPAAQQLLAEFKARETTADVWGPLIGVALIAFILGSKSGG